MRISRLLIGLACLLVMGSPSARAEYPDRSVEIVVGFAAGGPSDVLARVLAQWLTSRMGQQFIVVNKPGAGSNIATQSVAQAKPDGYTLLLVTTANTINPALYKTLPFDFLKNTTPVAGLVRFPFAMVVNPTFPAKTVAEFVSYAKANPGRVNFASAGNGGANHLAAELFQLLSGVKMVHVPYKGNSAVYPDLLSGRVHLLFADLGSSKEYIKAGTLRALGVTSTKPFPALPDVPTVASTLPGYEADAFLGFAAPSGTPKDIVDKLNREINAALADPAILKRFDDVAAAPMVFSPQEFGTFLTTATKNWGEAVKAAGVEQQ